MTSDPTNPAASRREYSPYVPPSVGTVGLWLFLAALFMLFAAGLIGYVLIREGLFHSNESVAPPTGWLRLPSVLWVSTALVVCVSVALRQAVHQLDRERQSGFRLWLDSALLLGIGFVVVQAPALTQLLLDHRRARTAHTGVFLYGFVFFLILLHALHVIGGIVALTWVAVRSRKGAYDHEHTRPVRHVASYWHFLDAVWLVMFGTFLLTR